MKDRNFKFRGILLLLIAFFVGYYFGVTKIAFDWKNYKPQIQAVSKEPPAELVTVDFSSFWNVWQRLASSYYDKSKLDPQKMLNGAISGMVESLGDPFTVYLPPTQNKNFKQGLAGQFSGIGAELGVKDGQIIVIAPLDGTPAQKTGIKAGDSILKVDGDSTSGWSLNQAVERIRGPKDTFVTLTVLHQNGLPAQAGKKAVDIRIKRDVITVKSVVGEVRSEKCETGNGKCKIAYIRLSQFGDNTNKDWINLINKIHEQVENDKNFKGLILDLRNNPGGYLSDAVFIASEFLREGKTVVLEDMGSFQTRSLEVKRAGKFTDSPIVVLINKGSASASEIVAAALKDHNRAKLVGETSFGKGTIQQAEELGGGAGIHITIARWLTPNGTWVDGKGLKPDFEVKSDQKDATKDPQLEKATQELLK